MSVVELRTLADLLERLLRTEKINLSESERLLAIRLVNALDQQLEKKNDNKVVG